MKSLNGLICVLFFCILYLGNNLHARTCAEDLRTHAAWLGGKAAAWTLGIPVFGVGFVLMGDALAEKHRVSRDASRLRAATVLLSAGPNWEKIRAQPIIDKFYAKLTREYPEMQMGKAQVVDRLKKLNFHEFGEDPCVALKQSSLANFFPEKAMNKWIMKFKAAKAKAIREQNAANARREKNQNLPWDESE